MKSTKPEEETELIDLESVKRRRLGRTGLEVTELGYGAMNLRMLDSFDEAYEIVNDVLDHGINLIDTARAYKGEIAPGVMLESEKIVGEVVGGRTDLAEPVVIITKGHAYTIPELEKDLDDSLRTLGVEGQGDLTIGGNPIRLIYLIHGISTERWSTIMSSGVLDRLQALKDQGVVNYIGFSSHYPFAREIREAADTGVFDVAELPYNVFNRSLGEDGDVDLLRYLHEKDMGIINMKAFDGNGMVPVYRILREFISIDYPAMLRFCLSNPYITTVDAGTRYPREYALDYRTALEPRLTPTQREALKAEADKIAGHTRSICRECMHCLEKFECPHGLDFQGILSVYSRYRILHGLGKDTAHLRERYQSFGLKGDACRQCGACLPWCEYKLKIPEMLADAHDILGR